MNSQSSSPPSSAPSSLMARIAEGPQENSKQLSQEAYDRLKDELTDLTTRGRTEIAQIIERARELGDLKENGDYHAAKEEQGKMEGRIRHLEHLLSNAEVIEADNGATDSATDGAAAVGSVVTIRHEDGDEEQFLLASVEEKVGDYDLLSPQSPLGLALVGKSTGEQVSYEVAHSGKSFSVEILKVEEAV